MAIKKFKEFTAIYEWGYDKYEDDRFEDYGEMMDPEIIPSNEPFKIIELKYPYAVLRSKSDNNLYLFILGDFDDSDFIPYAYLPKLKDDDPEFGKITYRNKEAFKLDSEVVEAYVNDNFNHLEFDEGIKAYEEGIANFILIDDPLKKIVKEELGFEKIN